MTRGSGSPIFDQYGKAYRKPFIGMMHQMVKSAKGIRAERCSRTRIAHASSAVAGRALTAALALALVWPAAVSASVLPADEVGAVAVSKSESLRAAAPDVSMASGVLVTGDGRVLWARAPERRRAIASITKVMTAIVVLDRLALTDKVTITAEATSLGESDAGLRTGDVLTVKDALAAMLVKSANEAALALAIRAAGSEKRFVALMNAKARELGMSGTKFANSHGLDEPGHYSTASDVAIMSRVAMADPVFSHIVRQRVVRLTRGGRARTYESSNRLLIDYAGASGVKTGWTNDAGHSVSASARRGGITLFAVVLGVDTDRARFDQAERLLDWGFDHYRAMRVATSGSVAGKVTVSDYIGRDVRALVSRNQTVTVFDLDGQLTTSSVLPDAVRAPVRKGLEIGMMRVTQRSRLLANVPLVSDRFVARPGLFERVGIAFRRVWLRLFG